MDSPSRRRSWLGLSAAAVLAAGCATSSPSWTYVPLSPPAIGSSAPSAGSSASASSSPSASGSSAPLSSGAAVLQLTAHNIAFDTSSLTAPAGVPFTIRFMNQDPGVPHDVAIAQGSASGTQLFRGQIITGVASIDYQVPSLPAGTYTLICVVHPTIMQATLTVK